MSRTQSRAAVWALGIAVAVTLLIATVGALAFQAESRRRGDVVARQVSSLVDAHRLVALSERRAHQAQEFLFTGRQGAVEARAAAHREFEATLARLELAVGSPEGAALLRRLREGHDALDRRVDALVQARQAGTSLDVLRDRLDSEVLPLRARVDTELEALVDRKQRRVDEALANSDRARRTGLIAFVAFTPLALGIVAVLGARLIRMVRARERERARAAEHLRHSEARLRRLFDTHLLGFVYWTADRHLTDANDAFLKTIGYTRADLTRAPLPWEALTPPEWKAQDEELVQELLTTGQHRLAEKEYFHRDGRRVPVLVAATCFPGTRSEGVGFVLDLTERKHAEEAMRAAAAALSESEARFQTLADHMSQLAWMADAQGDIFWFNRRWYEYTGTTFEQMKDSGWRTVHDPAQLTRVETRFRAAIASGEPWEDTFPLRRHDGELRWHLSRAMPLRDGDGRIVRWLGTNTDIEEERRQASALREAIRAREVFLSVAAHELKTPMTSLQLRLAQIRRELEGQLDADPTVERTVRAADVAQAQVRRLARLVEGLLDVSRLANDRFTLKLDELELMGLVRDVARAMAADAARRGASIHVEGPDYLVGQFDRMRIEQVLMNLLSNAVKFGAGKPIRVVVEQVDDRARLTVADQGIGIAPEFLHRVFDRFERGVSDRNYGGFGLGLFVTRQIIESSGGAIRVESAPGRGARFIVELPVRAEPLIGLEAS